MAQIHSQGSLNEYLRIIGPNRVLIGLTKNMRIFLKVVHDVPNRILGWRKMLNPFLRFPKRIFRLK